MATSRAVLRGALVGCGRIGAWTEDRLRTSLPPVWFPYSHLDALAEVADVELVAVADANEDAARRTAERFGAPRYYIDGIELVENERPDLLLIATRTAGRAELLEVAAANGVRGVHLEKPLARSLRACREALDAAESAGIRLGYGAVRRYMDIARRAKEEIESGRLGALRHVVAESRTSELLWAHPHTFDLFSFMVGMDPPVSVQSRMRIVPETFDGVVLDADPLVEMVAIAYTSGVSASIIDTGVGITRFVCEAGEVVLGGNMAWLAIIERGSSVGAPVPRQVDVPLTGSGRLRALRELADAVRLGRPTSHQAVDILRTNELSFAAAWSALHGGRAVTIAEVPEEFEITGRIGDLYA